MRIRFLILLVTVLILVNCDSKEDESVNNDKIVELDLVNKEAIRLWCRSIFSFEAKKNGQYIIESQDNSIAEVSVEGKKFTIRTRKPGTTEITIKSKSGEKSVLKCYSRTFANVWVETAEVNRIYTNSAIVAATDKSVAEQLRTALKPISLNRGYQYTFAEDTNELTVWTAEGPVQGTYLWEVETQTLTLNYNGRTERYFCDIQPAYPNFFQYTPRFIVAIKQDLTEEYASKYPEAGITDVYIIRHIMALGDYWLITKESELSGYTE